MNVICKSATLTATLMLSLLAAAVQAQEATQPDAWLSDFRSERTRADVHAELMQSRASGEALMLASEAHAFMPLRRGTVSVRIADTMPKTEPMMSSDATRTEVQLALYRAHASGELARLNGEAWDFTVPTGTAAADTLVAALER
jgi:hypothetical protein